MCLWISPADLCRTGLGCLPPAPIIYHGASPSSLHVCMHACNALHFTAWEEAFYVFRQSSRTAWLKHASRLQNWLWDLLCYWKELWNLCLTCNFPKDWREMISGEEGTQESHLNGMICRFKAAYTLRPIAYDSQWPISLGYWKQMFSFVSEWMCVCVCVLCLQLSQCVNRCGYHCVLCCTQARGSGLYALFPFSLHSMPSFPHSLFPSRSLSLFPLSFITPLILLVMLSIHADVPLLRGNKQWMAAAHYCDANDIISHYYRISFIN